MNIRDKKVQHAIIGSVVGCAFIYLLLQFLILPDIDSWKRDSAKTVEIRKKSSEMRALIESRPVIQEQIDDAKSTIRKMDQNIPLPVLGNYLLGMEEHIHACAGRLGVTITAISDNDVLDISPENRKFKVYRVRVQVKTGFDEYIKLAQSIHASNPFCSISGLNITAHDDSPLVHETVFLVAWLVWSDPANRPAFLMEGRK